MKLKSKKLILSIVVLSILNVWLLYSNYVSKKQINNIISIQNNKPAPYEIETRRWGFEQSGDKPAKIIHPDVDIGEKSLFMAAFFTDNGCSYCVKHEVSLLNELNEKYNGELKVYLLSQNESFLERLYGAEFDYSTIDPQEKLLNNDFEFRNPVTLLADKNGVVQISHIAEKDNEEKSNQFYKRISSLLLSLKR